MLTKSKSFLYIILALAAGVALLLLPGSGGTESKTISAPSASEYTAALEKKVASLIGELDGLADLYAFADRLEKATLDTIESGVMTKDLAALYEGEARAVNSKAFLGAIAERM